MGNRRVGRNCGDLMQQFADLPKHGIDIDRLVVDPGETGLSSAQAAGSEARRRDKIPPVLQTLALTWAPAFPFFPTRNFAWPLLLPVGKCRFPLATSYKMGYIAATNPPDRGAA